MKLAKGFGCVSTIIGSMIMALAVFFAVACFVADKEAGEKNQVQWEEYNSHLTEIDSLEKAGVADSIIYEKYPRPVIRQGGFATLFGGFFALVAFAVGAIPFTIGLLLYNKKS